MDILTRLANLERKIRCIACSTGNNNGGSTADLQSVSDLGSVTTNPLTSKNSLQVGQPATAFVGKIVGDNLTSTRTYLVPDKNGTFAMLSDVSKNVLSINTLADFITTTPDASIDIILSKDNIGGTFLKYSGVSPVDNGVIFADAVGTKWKRVIDNNYINVDWFMNPTTGWATPAWAAAFSAAKNIENLPFARIYFPARALGYIFMAPVIINAKVEIFGDGSNSILKFGDASSNYAGFTFNYITSRGSILRDIIIKGNAGAYSSATPWGSDWDKNMHGIIIKDVLYCENVTSQGFSGSGFYMNGNVGYVPDPTNVNTSLFTNCHAIENKKHGYEILGQDANAIGFEKCDAISNGATGFHDYCFLGNNYRAIHSASNSSPEITWQRSLVKYLGVSYYCIVDGTVGVLPTVTTNWLPTPLDWTGWSSVKTYDPTVTYYEGGAWSLKGLNQYGTMVGCYSESDQPPSFADQRVVLVNANAAYRGNVAQLAANSAQLYSKSFYAGDPSGGATPNYFIDQTLGVGTKFGAITLAMYGDNTNGSTAMSGAYFRVFSYLSTSANQNRIANAGGLPKFDKGILMTTIDENSSSHRIFINNTFPTDLSYDCGDLLIHVPYVSPGSISNDRPETVAYKKLANTGTNKDQWKRIAGYAEYTFTTTNAALIELFTDVNGVQLCQYDLTITARNTTTGDCYAEKRIVTVTPTANALPLLVRQSTVLQMYSEGAMSGIVIGIDIRGGGRDTRLYVNGIASTNINWTVKVNRIVSS